MKGRRYCRICSVRVITGDRSACDPCAESDRKRKAAKRAMFPAGACNNCGREKEAGYKTCKTCREITRLSGRRHRDRDPELYAKKTRDNARRRRLRVLDHYGGKCACCGEGRFEFLAIDHINNDGRAHRLQIGHGSGGIVRWLINENFPKGFRVLCHNCNMAMGFYGACPHQKEGAQFQGESDFETSKNLENLKFNVTTKQH